MLVTAVELVGVAAFAASGALVGVTKYLDLFGVCVVGCVTALGGGVLRDLLLGIHPPVAFTAPAAATISVAVSLLVFRFHPIVRRRRREILLLDAVGMGLFASSGAAVALDRDAGAAAAVLIGMLTAVGGAVLRDTLVNEVPMLLRHDLYAVPALLGSFLVAVIAVAGVEVNVAVAIGTAVATMTRLAAIRQQWALPKPRDPL
ncbi:MAG: trimeric intracellular cation channel family protein [Mycolicibacterium rufum]|nr:trimeric intracellular cation channel family protein [Mycolicibacterium rufum]